jgi:hypothetical protein
LTLAGGLLVVGAGVTAKLLSESWGERIAKIEPIGWWAIAIGALLSLLLAGGLSALMVISARGGYDDRVQDQSVETQDGA